MTPSHFVPEPVQLSEDDRAAREAQMRSYLEAIAEGPKLREHDISIRVEPDIAPAATILSIAEETDADLIVLGTHGRGGLRRLLLGSVADKVIRGTHRPVLVHRGEEPLARLIPFRDRHGRSEHSHSHLHS